MTTSHVTHQQEAFIDYTPLGNSSITGVDGKEVNIAGQGTVELDSTCNGHNYILHLENIIHVPGTQNNLISLGSWDVAGGCYSGGNSEIILIMRDGKPIVHGNKICNHLYRMKMTIRNPFSLHDINTPHNQTFISNNSSLSWETWHCHFVHVGYTGLQKFLNRKLVNGFNVDQQSPKPSCVACTEAKQHVYQAQLFR